MTRMLGILTAGCGLAFLSTPPCLAGWPPYHPYHPPVALTYVEKEIETYKYVCETQWNEVRTKIKRPSIVEEMVDRKTLIAVPELSSRTVDCSYTVMDATPVMVTKEVCRLEYIEEKYFRTVRVDCGRWEGHCRGGCFGHCSCRIWVPCVVEKQVPCIRLVPKLVTTMVQEQTFQFTRKTVPCQITVPECKIVYKEVIEKVPVKKCVWHEEEVISKVPHVIVKKVPIKKIVRVPICSSLTHGYPSIYSGIVISPVETIPPPQDSKDDAKKSPKKGKGKT